MAENPYLDLAVEVALSRYDLDGEEWGLTSFSESAKSFSVGLTNGITKLKVTFDRGEILFEEMKRWSKEKKKAYVKHLMDNGEELPEELEESFFEAINELDIPAVENEDDAEESIMVEEEPEEVEKEEEAEAVKEEPKKIIKKFKRKAI